MQHTVTVQETGQVLFNLTLRAALASDKAPYLDVVAPLGFFLPAGLDLSIDGKALINLPVQRCDAKGCYAGSVLNEEQLEMLQDNDIMNISFSPQREQVAEVAVPLTGFGSAYDGIKH